MMKIKHKGNYMIEKRCKIDFKKASYITIKCAKCKSETSIPLQGDYTTQTCGVCEKHLGEPLIAYVKNLKKLEFLSDEFDVSLVSIEVE